MTAGGGNGGPGRRGQRPTLKLAGTLVLALPAFLLVLKEPDLGTSLVFLALPLPMMPIPEPGTAPLLALGLLWLACRPSRPRGAQRQPIGS